MSRFAPPELEGEQEVDLRSLWQRLAHRWWLPAGGLVLGAVIGALVAFGGGDTYRAETLLYRGQPFTPGAGGQISTLGTNWRNLDRIIRSEAALRATSAASGIPVSKLRGNIRSDPVTQPELPRALTPLTEIIVLAEAPPGRVEKAADTLAQRVIDRISAYVDVKISSLERQIATANTELINIQRRIDTNLAQQQRVLTNRNLSLVERLLLNANLNATLGQLENRRGSARENFSSGTQYLALARDVERARIVEPAVARKQSATTFRNGALVGALIGVVLGVLAAYLADPVLARRNARAAAG